MTISILAQHKTFAGLQLICQHESIVTQSKMRFGIFIPKFNLDPAHKARDDGQRLPVLYWLSGLTCTEENFIIKAGAQRIAAELGIVLVAPDTSPRNLNLPDENASFDFGSGAGFYVNATQPPWNKHYQMADYITLELPQLITDKFPVDGTRTSIFGHSMGGHGALTLAIKNPDKYRSVSAFAPICSTTQCAWGIKALQGYLGDRQENWLDYDATALLRSRGWNNSVILIDQGTEDPYLTEQLKPHLLLNACEQAGVNLNLRMQNGYDHSYFFVATFIEDHLRFHSQYLNA